MHHNLARYGPRCPHIHDRQATQSYDFATLNLVDRCAVVLYAHALAWAGDGTFLPNTTVVLVAV